MCACSINNVIISRAIQSATGVKYLPRMLACVYHAWMHTHELVIFYHRVRRISGTDESGDGKFVNAPFSRMLIIGYRETHRRSPVIKHLLHDVINSIISDVITWLSELLISRRTSIFNIK